MKFSRAIRHLNMKDVNRKQLQKEKALKEGTLSEEPTMTTSNIYPETSEIPNQDLSNFEAIMTGGERLGFSGADGNIAGNAGIGDEGAALSPPHPVTGVRRTAFHVRDGLGGTTPLKPGQTTTRGFSDNPPVYTMGSCLWFYDADHDNGAGQPAGKWCNLEYSNFDATAGQWFFWDTIKSGQFAGVYVVNTDLSQHPCGDISDLIDGLNFPGIGGSLGAAKIPVLTVKGLETEPIYPGPIANLFGLGQRGLDWLMGLMGKAAEAAENIVQKAAMPMEIATSVGKNEPVNAPEPSESEIDEFFDNLNPNDIFNPDNPFNIQTSGIPINDDKQPYADENIYVDENGNVQSNIGPNGEKEYYEKNTTAPASENSTVGQRGQAQSQVYQNENGEWMFSYEDHAYDNLNSTDADETVNFATTASEITHRNADEKHGRNNGEVKFPGTSYETKMPDNTSPNTGGMSGYPCNSTACIRGDSVQKFEIPVSEIKNQEIKNTINSAIAAGKNQNESYISESVKLGHFEPDILDVDINDIRKGIMPEYPKQPPAEMIDGYHQKSPLRPKPLDNAPYVKITKADLIRNHRLKPSEADEMMDTINRLNDYIKKHPEDLIHAQQRYPKDDPRLAELNWKMDQMLEAGKDYLDKNFKENSKLFKRAIDRTKNNIKLTDPKYAQQRYDELRGTTKPKKTNLVGRLGKHLNKYESKGVLRHVDSDDFKKINERKNEEKEQIKKIQEQAKEIQKEIKIEFQEKKNDWRKDLGNITY